jgi:glycerol-3-phosphate dehydrogenase (NAD(P)+)
MATVTIIGAGMMGTAMCWPLVDRGHDVRLVGTPLDDDAIRSINERRVHPGLDRVLPPGVEAVGVAELQAAISGADLIINGVSSFGIDWFARTAGPHLDPKVPVLSVTKGLEDQPDGRLLTLPVALERKLPAGLHGRIRINAIGGPCIAAELAARRSTSVVFTGQDGELLAELRELLATPYYHISTSTDVTGVEVCAALKNGYALAVAIAVGQMEAAGPDGLANAYNPQAALVGQSCLEMRRMVELLGGDPRQVSWLPGAGDLYVTVFGGRTLRLGRLLGHGTPTDEARRMLEGVTLESVEIVTRATRALRQLERTGLASTANFPLLVHLDRVVNQGEPVGFPWNAFSGLD